MDKNLNLGINIDAELSSYIAKSGEAVLPAEVIARAKQAILDSLAAVISGSSLKPGQIAKKYAESQGGRPESTLVNSTATVSAINAAFAHGIMGHADETDDYHLSGTHPGCVIVPAALAMAEREEADGMSFLRAVVTGYDIACRIVPALGLTKGPHNPTFRDSFSIGGHFGAAAAAASLARLNPDSVRYVLSYTAQQTAGLTSWLRDEEHIEKAFVFAGMPARNGVNAAILVQSGFTGVTDSLSGKPGFFVAFSFDAKPDLLISGLGSRYEIMSGYIKKYSVGAPILAPVDGLLLLMEKHGIRPGDVESIVVSLPDDGARTVNNRKMPDINVQHIMAITLLDGELTFKSSHSYERMNDPAVLELKKRITLQTDPELSASKIWFQGIVEVTTKDGAKLKEHVKYVSGNPNKPMTTQEIEKKCKELMTPVLGEDRTNTLVNKILTLERVTNMRQLRPLLSQA